MENTPILNMSLKEYYNIIYNGGKITRNKTEQLKTNNEKLERSRDSKEKSIKLNKNSAIIKVKKIKKDSKVKMKKKDKKLVKKKKFIKSKMNGKSTKDDGKKLNLKTIHKQNLKNIHKDQNGIFSIDYDIVPFQFYNYKNNNTYLFELNEKIHYYKFLNFQIFKERFLLFKLKKNDQTKYSLGFINEIKEEEENNLIIQLGSVSEFTNDTFPFAALNQDKILIDSNNYDLFLVDYTFCLNINGEIDFLIILTDFLFKNDYSKSFIENKYYSNCFSLNQNRIISNLENRKLILLEDVCDENSVLNNKNLLFFQKINKIFRVWIEKIEFHNINIAIIENYELYECIYPKNENYQLGLFLKYNKPFDSVLVANYNGQFEWISLTSTKDPAILPNLINTQNTSNFCENGLNLLNYEEKSFKINFVKGKVSLSQLSKIVYNKNFYKNLVFYSVDNLNNKLEIENNQNIKINNMDKITTEEKEEINRNENCKNIECQVCTYKINNFEFRKCKNCRKALHVECMAPFEKNYDHDDVWLCKECKPCKNCHNILKIESKYFCTICFDCYHYECLHEMLKKGNLNENFSFTNWKCENCAKCLGCDKMLFRNLMIPNAPTSSSISKRINNLEYCSTCEKRIQKNEFCPICRKLWKQDEIRMIECKCKMWIHQICDRILTDDNFKKLSKKTHNYLCPQCRINEKNSQTENILNSLIKQDKYGYFSMPVEKVKNYTTVIKKPMCFLWMKDKVEKGFYLEHPDEFQNDFTTIFTNAKTFNMPNTKIYKEAEIIFDRGIEILLSNMHLLYEISLDYYLFDHFFPNNDFKEIIKFLKGIFDKKNEIINFDKIKEKIKDYKVSLNINELMTESKNDSSQNNFIQNEISKSDSSNSLIKIKKSSNLNNINIYEESKFNQMDLQILQHIEKNNIYFQKKSEEVSSKSDEIKDSSNVAKSSKFPIINNDHQPNNIFNERLDSNKIESVISSIKIPFENESLIKLEKPISNIESNENFTYTNPRIETTENLINIKIIEEEKSSDIPLKEEQKFISENEKDKPEMVNNKMEICNDIAKNPQDPVKPKSKPKIIIKKLKSKIAKGFENFYDKSMNNFSFKSKNECKLENKMEITETYNQAKDEEENFLSNYVISHTNGLDNSLKFLYLKKSKTILKEKYESYLEFAYGCSVLREDVKDLKKKKKIKKEMDKISKDPKKRLKLISKIKEKKEIIIEIKEEKPKTSRKESLDQEYLKKKKERPKLAEINPEFIKETFNINDKSNNSKFKSEDVLFQENYNFKSLIPPPILIAFSDPSLIFNRNCYLCASFDNSEYMITCSLCYESFHSFCTSNSDQLTNNINIIKKTKWKCLNCKFCENCKTNTNDHQLLYCDSCDSSLHTYCLDIKLYQIPESGWKCLNCFKCQNCKKTKYYSDTFKLDERKDYSILTRNFNFCFECGLQLFFQSFCSRCEKSEYKDYSKNFVFVHNKNDVLDKYEKQFKLGSDENIIVMISCVSCKNWFHLQCLGFNKEYLKKYYQEYDDFRCLDCFTENKYKNEFQEIAYIRYLELIQMCYIIMSFSKLILIILKQMTIESNIKLHSKFFKVFLKENIRRLLKDQDICFFIDAIKQDISPIDKTKNRKNKNKKSSLKLIKNEEIDKIVLDSTGNMVKNKSNDLIDDEINRPEAMVSTRNNDKYFDLNNHLKHKNLFKERFLLDKYKYFTDPTLNINDEIYNKILLADNLLIKNKIFNYSKLDNINEYIINEEKDKIIINDQESRKVNNEVSQENFDLTEIAKSKEKLETIALNNSNKKLKRISLINDINLRDDLNNFLISNEKNIKIFQNYFNQSDTMILNFYSFDYANYFSSYDDNETQGLINETLKKLESYLKAKDPEKIFSKFWLNLNHKIIIKLKVEFLKWLLEKIRDSYTNKDFGFGKKISLIYPFYLDFSDKYIIENPFISGDLIPQDQKQDEELSKLIDYIDPLENNITTSLVCELCNRKGARKYSGRLIPLIGEQWGHINCIMWSRGVIQNVDNSFLNLLLVMNKMKTFKCYLCRKNNATLSCDSKKCNKNYHFTCALIKQSSFTKNKQFFCNKCFTTKDEYIYDFNTLKKYTVIKNTDWVHDLNLLEKSKYQLIQKYLFGTFNKYGNTTIVKLANLKLKENVFDSFDIICIKNIRKENKDINLLFILNDKFITMSKISNEKLFTNIQDKIVKIYNKVDKDFYDKYLSNLLEKDGIFLNMNVNKTIDFSNEPQIKNFNELFEDYLRKNLFTHEELELCNKINRKISNCFYFFNINFIPISIFLKYSTFYISQYSDFSTNCEKNVNFIKHNNIETKNYKKEAKNKLENLFNSIKEKNKSGETFKFMDYLSNHKSIKIVRKNLGESATIEKEKKTINKYNKQMYKNLDKTMNTNIMEMDLPLAMKYRNYKALNRKVTVGPSLIHRNGLMATGDFLPGEIVIEYCGELITNLIADFREKEYNIRGFGDCYLFRLDTNQIIDATKYGNLARFINHRCDPNCSAQSNIILDKKHIILYAKRNIKAGEEITYDYNFECEAEKILCRCGAKNCQGRLN